MDINIACPHTTLMYFCFILNLCLYLIFKMIFILILNDILNRYKPNGYWDSGRVFEKIIILFINSSIFHTSRYKYI